MGIKASSLRCLLHRARARFHTPSSPAYLPNELVSDILSRVPERSVCRFRCVSKEWRALVSDPAFVAAHRSRAEPFLVVASQTHAIGLRLVDLDGNVVRVIGDLSYGWKPVPTSPDDMVCVVASLGSYGNVAGVIDDATMKVFFTRLEDGRQWGFGRAVPSGVYKIVRFRDDTYCEVLTIGDCAKWRSRISRPFRHKFCGYDEYTAAVNGMLYFLPKEGLNMDFLLCFDLETEEWKNDIKGPPSVKLSCYDINLGELNGALYLAEPKNWKTNHGCTNIWLLTDHDSGIWVKAYMIPLELPIPSGSAVHYCMIALKMLQDCSKLLIYYNAGIKGVDLGRPPVLQIYDPRDGTCKDLTKRLLGDHGHIVGFCSSHLGRSTSTKIQHQISPFRVI